MECLINIFSQFEGKALDNYPKITYSNLYRHALEQFYFEFEIKGEKHLFSPLYTQIRGPEQAELSDFVKQNGVFFDSFKRFVLNSLYVYSALIEENSYYLTNPQSVLIARVSHKKDVRFEIKFYTHFQEELFTAYDDKIYIGRDFVNMMKFSRKYLGLKKYFRSLSEQNEKIQERAKHMLRYYKEYERPYMNEITYLTRETVSDAFERLALINFETVFDVPKAGLQDTLDTVHLLANLMLEIHDFITEFEQKLRLGEEHLFIKYLTKFFKDIEDGVRYLKKLSVLLHHRISNYP